MDQNASDHPKDNQARSCCCDPILGLINWGCLVESLLVVLQNTDVKTNKSLVIVTYASKDNDIWTGQSGG